MLHLQPSRRQFVGLTASASALAMFGAPLSAQDGPAEMVILNARVTTMDPARPDAEAVAIRGGRFVAVGGSADVQPYVGSATIVIDAEGRRMIPGLNDSHTHTVREGLNYALELRWDGIRTLAEAMARLRAMVARTPPGHWVRVVGGFSPNQFEEGRMPTLDELNAVAPDTPVYVLFLYTHALLNRAALAALGVDRATPDNRWPAARIERDSTGLPTGLFVADPAPVILYDSIWRAPQLSFDDALVSTRHFMREQNRLGITSTLDCGGGYQNWPEDYAVVRALHEAGKMTVRIGASTFIQRPGRELEDFRRWTAEFRPREGDDWFRVIGGGEMLVLSAYDYEIFGNPRVVPSDRAEADLEPVVRHLAESDWSFRFHATYGETVARHLDVLERVHRDTPLDRLHWIVDHAETLSERDIERIAAMGGGVAVQNRIAFQEREFLDRYGQSAAEDAPPIRKIMAAGVPVGAGTDMSRVSSYSPWLCLEWLVTGKGVGGLQLLGPNTRLDRAEALRLWTDNGWFSQEQGEKGRIAPGLLADAALLSDDYFAVPDSAIRDLTAMMTIAGGRVVWGEGPFAALMEELPPLRPDWSPVNLFGGYRPDPA